MSILEIAPSLIKRHSKTLKDAFLFNSGLRLRNSTLWGKKLKPNFKDKTQGFSKISIYFFLALGINNLKCNSK